MGMYVVYPPISRSFPEVMGRMGTAMKFTSRNSRPHGNVSPSVRDQSPAAGRVSA
jgi:hypothetical protein